MSWRFFINYALIPLHLAILMLAFVVGNMLYAANVELSGEMQSLIASIPMFAAQKTAVIANSPADPGALMRYYNISFSMLVGFIMTCALYIPVGIRAALLRVRADPIFRNKPLRLFFLTFAIVGVVVYLGALKTTPFDDRLSSTAASVNHSDFRYFYFASISVVLTWGFAAAVQLVSVVIFKLLAKAGVSGILQDSKIG